MMTFEDCLSECISNKDFVKEFNRLTGLKLGNKRTGIEKAIDEACGHDPDMDAMPEFVALVYKCVWMPLINAQHANSN